MINIGYLYYDLLNLYGENGNIKALKTNLEKQDIKVNIHFITIDDKPDFTKYDLIYIGSGTENNLKMVVPHIMKYQKQIKEEIKKGKFYLITGNAINLFGKYIIDENHEKIETLNAFNFYSKIEPFRMIDDGIMKCSFLKNPVIGFQNQSTIIKDNKHPMFKVIKGIGSYPKSSDEGILYKNFYGTYLIGPLLIRNPEFLDYFIKKLLKSKNIKYKKLDLKLENIAYNDFINKHYQDVK